MKTARSAAIAVMSCFLLFGAGQTSGQRLDDSLLKAEVIAVARLTSYVDDPGLKEQQQEQIKAAKEGQGISPSKFGNLFGAKRLPGTYTFSVSVHLKGSCPETISFHDPLPIRWYEDYRVEHLDFKEGGNYVLLLSSAGGQLAPVDQHRPLIPLAQNIAMPTSPPADAADIDQQVKSTLIGLMIASVDDQVVRAAVLRLLSYTVDPRVAETARHFWNDPDYSTQAAALFCSATNQDIDALPKIMEVTKIRKAGVGTLGLLPALETYKSPQALPKLNALLFDPNLEIRNAAIMAIRSSRLADQSSIPYLIMALRDPDPQAIVPNIASQTLHELIPALGPPKARALFLQSRDQEIQAAEAWWVDELAGRHKNDVPLVRPRSGAPPATPQSNPRASRGPAD